MEHVKLASTLFVKMFVYINRICVVTYFCKIFAKRGFSDGGWSKSICLLWFIGEGNIV